MRGLFALLTSFSLACYGGGSLSFASIDTRGELFSSSSEPSRSAEEGQTPVSTHQSMTVDSPIPVGGEPVFMKSTHLELTPLTMNRDLSIMTHFSALPQDYQMTVKQFLLNYESGDKMEFSAQVMRPGTSIFENSSSASVASLSMSTPFLHFSSFSEMFVQVDESQTASSSSSSSSPVTVGTRGKGSLGRMEWKSEFAYEDYFAADVVGSPAFKAALCGTVKMKTAVPSEFNVNLLSAGRRSLEEELHYLGKKRTGGVFSPVLSNLSVLNTQLACNPRKNLFLSVDYYYYLQNELKVQSYSPENSPSEMARTNGESTDLGEELNLRAAYAYSEACRSQLLAGWFDPGAAYGKTEDTKTFEIRGEIIVNF